MFAVLALSLLAPLSVAAAEESGAGAASNATLGAFADGSVSKTLSFASGADAASSVILRLPSGAVVSDAALSARAAASSQVSGGALVFDIGADGTADATASVSVVSATRVVLPQAALNAFLEAHANGSAQTDIVVKVTAAAAAAWSCVLNAVEVHYAVEGAVAIGPHFAGEIGAVAVGSGESNRSAVDLAGYFTGGANGTLTYAATLAADADASAGLLVQVNGSKVDLRSQNANWWGDVSVVFSAVDAEGQVAQSNAVEVHVTPSPPSAPTVRTEARAAAEAVVVAACGSPAAAGSFEVPADAVVTEARLSLEAAAHADLLGATVDILAGAEAAAGVELGDLPATLELNASVLNARLRGSPSQWGLVSLDVAVDLCPSAAVALTVSNLTLTYTRGAGNQTPPQQVIAGITVEGQAAATVESDTELALALATNGTLAPGTRVEWFIDGEAAGSGAAITADALTVGNHTIEARANEGLQVRVYTTTVQAKADAQARAQIAFDGAVKGTVESGTALIAELRLPEPLEAGATVEWYVDGRFVGRGQVLANLTLAPGTHTVEAREQSQGEVHNYAAQVTASGPAGQANLVAALLVSGLLIVGALAVMRSRRRR